MSKTPRPHHHSYSVLGKARRKGPGAPHSAPSAGYEILVGGHLDSRWSVWFEGMRVATKGDETVISGDDIDQPKLRGILNKICDLSLTLISVRRLAGEKRGGR